MVLIPVLIGIPVLLAVLMALLKDGRIRGIIVYAGAGCIMAATLALLAGWGAGGYGRAVFFTATETVDHLMTVGEIGLMLLIVFMSVKYHKVLPAVLSVAQTGLILYVEQTAPIVEKEHMMVDWLTVLMCVIIAFVGGFICIYTVGYMKGYHEHHKEYKDRQPFFFSMLFLFLAAMFGLVFSQSLIWMYFFWEITSVISFLMIGYTRTEEALENSFSALWMNLLGGLGFAAAIAVLAFTQGMPAEYFKKEENQQVLIEAAGQLTGKEISLDVRFVENRQEMNALPELRNIIKNVEIEMLD